MKVHHITKILFFQFRKNHPYFFIKLNLFIKKYFIKGTLIRTGIDLSFHCALIVIYEGWGPCLRKIHKKIQNPYGYALVVDRYIYFPIPDEKIKEYQNDLKNFTYTPCISVLTPVYNVQRKWLRLCIESVLQQVYDNWELCLVDDGSTARHIKDVLLDYSRKDSRIKVKILEKNCGISVATNEALAMATGEFIYLLDDDDEISKDALYQFIKILNANPSFDLIYSDEDRIDIHNDHFQPFFKPDWSPSLLFSFMYLGHSLYRKSIVTALGGFRSDFDYSQDYDLAFRFVESTHRIGHVPKILYHWRSLPGSAAGGGKIHARQSNIAALQAVIKRRGYTAKALCYPSANRLKFVMTSFPPISIIIPTDDRDNLLSCVRSILNITDYPNFEIIIVTNTELGNAVLTLFNPDTRIRIAEYNREFNFSAKCNHGAKIAKGTYFLFLNDDVEVISRDWLENMIEVFGRPEVGAVAPKLIYEDHTIQHAGLVTGVRGLVGTAFHLRPEHSTEYFNLIQSTREVSALSAACLLLPRSIFESIHGFDEINTPIMHSDLDLSFKIREKGYSLIYTPFTTLKHKGHRSIGKVEKSYPVRVSDRADLYLIHRWSEYINHDPYYTSQMRDYLYEDRQYFKIILNPKKMHIHYPKEHLLFISHELTYTGAPLIIFNLSKYLTNVGYSVTIISPKNGDLTPLYSEQGIPVIIDSSIIDHPLPETRKFLRNFDLVVANTILTWNSIYICKELHIPIVWIIQETEWGRNAAYRKQEIANAFNIADRVIFLTHAQALIYNKFIEHKFSLLYSGIDAGEIQDHPKQKNSNKLTVICVGTIESRKGQDILIKSIKNFPPEFSGNFEFNIIGRILEVNYYNDLKIEIAKIDNVHFLGQIPHQEMQNYYSDADIFICVSRDEAMGLVLLEAMSHGNAIIATNVGGIPEIIEDGVTGILIPPDDPQSLLNAILTLYNNEKLRLNLGLNAKKKFSEQYTLDKFGERFLKILYEKSLLNESTNTIK